MQLGPLRPQGLDQADVGGHGRAARRRQLGGHRPLGARLRRRLPRAARGHPRRPRPGRRGLRRLRATRGRGGLRPHRGARRPRLPAVLVPLPDLQPPHRRLRRAAGEPAALPARGLRRGARRRTRRTSRSPCASRRPTGCPTATPTRTPSRSRAPSSSTARRRSTSRRARSARTRSRRSAGPTRPPSPTRSATASPSPAGAKVIAVGAISSYDDVNSILLAGRADFCALGRTAPLRPELDAPRGRRAGLRRSRRGLADAVGGRAGASRRRRAPTRSRRGSSCCARAWPTTSTCGGRPGAQLDDRRRGPLRDATAASRARPW